MSHSGIDKNILNQSVPEIILSLLGVWVLISHGGETLATITGGDPHSLGTRFSLAIIFILFLMSMILVFVAKYTRKVRASSQDAENKPVYVYNWKILRRWIVIMTLIAIPLLYRHYHILSKCHHSHALNSSQINVEVAQKASNLLTEELAEILQKETYKKKFFMYQAYQNAERKLLNIIDEKVLIYFPENRTDTNLLMISKYIRASLKPEQKIDSYFVNKISQGLKVALGKGKGYSQFKREFDIGDSLCFVTYFGDTLTQPIPEASGDFAYCMYYLQNSSSQTQYQVVRYTTDANLLIDTIFLLNK